MTSSLDTVGVKALEWRTVGEGYAGFVEGESYEGVISSEAWARIEHTGNLAAPYWYGRNRYAELIEAKAAAQADFDRRIRSALAAPVTPQAVEFQGRVAPWMDACFGPEISADRIERNHRFLEEALELVQSTGCTASEAHQLVDYVYGRPAGETHQEIGGVMVTLAALCLAIGDDMHKAGETELARIWTKVEKIRAKQAAKPKHSPLPASPQPAPHADLVEALHMAEIEAIIASKKPFDYHAAGSWLERHWLLVREAIAALSAVPTTEGGAK